MDYNCCTCSDRCVPWHSANEIFCDFRLCHGAPVRGYYHQYLQSKSSSHLSVRELYHRTRSSEARTNTFTLFMTVLFLILTKSNGDFVQRERQDKTVIISKRKLQCCNTASKSMSKQTLMKKHKAEWL